jgi:hypothetical protein
MLRPEGDATGGGARPQHSWRPPTIAREDRARDLPLPDGGVLLRVLADGSGLLRVLPDGEGHHSSSFLTGLMGFLYDADEA